MAMKSKWFKVYTNVYKVKGQKERVNFLIFSFLLPKIKMDYSIAPVEKTDDTFKSCVSPAFDLIKDLSYKKDFYIKKSRDKYSRTAEFFIQSTDLETAEKESKNLILKYTSFYPLRFKKKIKKRLLEMK